MLYRRNFDFGEVIVDVDRAIIFLDRGQGKEILESTKENKEIRRQIFDWIHDDLDMDYHDESRLAWQYKTYFNCPEVEDIPDIAEGAPLNLELSHHEKKEEIRLEITNPPRFYYLRRVTELGIFLINSEKLVHLLGTHSQWMAWDQDKCWSVIRPLDELEERLIQQIIGGGIDRFFQ